MKSGNKQIINVVTLDIDKCCEGNKQNNARVIGGEGVGFV